MGFNRKNIPNYLTYFRIVIIPVLIVVFFLTDYIGRSGYYISAFLFALASFTDWLDGYAARLWQAQSNIGRFLDPIADKLLVATVLLLMVAENRVSVIPAIAIVCREILVSGLREYLAEIRIGVPVSKLSKFKTAAQMLAIFLLLLGAGAPSWLYADFLGNILLWLAAALTVVTGYAYLKTGMKHMSENQ
ncbi:MAG: CDP-diacylglycerol--glycerol-3-phosphate 3-phosphatidyltransferase [Rickettsiales bacterium]